MMMMKNDAISPHIDDHAFDRPFFTVSMLSQQPIRFGAGLTGPTGQRDGGKPTLDIPLPRRSILTLDGNGADLARHCVPCVLSRRMSITLRRMGRSSARAIEREAWMIAAKKRPLLAAPKLNGR
jgi:alkylated DNA repair protein alkB family protein 5|tara:strand:- start:1774 stop:2145 length:372 start_codon:yes stop_codon:yes gene_type:complete